MPATKTKQLARKLGLVQSKKRKREETGGSNKRRKRNGQLLSYLIVIDFESTCWENRKGFQEIIEFPAVLLDLQTGKVVEEFQQYVLPRDNPRLSDFCKNLTGISQEQVDNGVPIATCLYLFSRWMRKLSEERHVVLMEPGQEYSEEMDLCALATWSDWDLEVCLNYECRRKQIRKSNYFNQWIDIRATYKKFYDQKPAGLNGAMEDLGIVFTGRQHSGIDDARNTAKLCYRMVRDGCRLDITKCIQNNAKPAAIRAPAKATSICAKDTSTKAVHPATGSVKTDVMNTPSNITSSSTNVEKNTSTYKPTLLVQPKTATTNHSLNEPCTSERSKSEQLSPEKDVTYECHWADDLLEDIAGELDEWDNDSITTEYLKNNHNVKDKKLHRDNDKVHTPSTCTNNIKHTKLPAPLITKPLPLQECNTLARGTPSRPDFVSHIAPITLMSYSSKKSGERPTVLTSPIMCAQASVIPSMTSQITNSSGSASEVCVVQETPPSSALDHGNQQSSSTHNDRLQSQKMITSTPLVSHGVSFGRHSANTSSTYKTSNSSLGFRTPSTSEWMKVKRLSTSSTHTPNNCSHDGIVLLSGGKVTPPLCNCGKRTKRRTASNPGPNEGKTFYACPNGKASDKSRGCGFFKWEVHCSPTSLVSPHSYTSPCSVLESEYVESNR